MTSRIVFVVVRGFLRSSPILTFSKLSLLFLLSPTSRSCSSLAHRRQWPIHVLQIPSQQPVITRLYVPPLLPPLLFRAQSPLVCAATRRIRYRSPLGDSRSYWKCTWNSCDEYSSNESSASNFGTREFERENGDERGKRKEDPLVPQDCMDRRFDRLAVDRCKSRKGVEREGKKGGELTKSCLFRIAWIGSWFGSRIRDEEQ